MKMCGSKSEQDTAGSVEVLFKLTVNGSADAFYPLRGRNRTYNER